MQRIRKNYRKSLDRGFSVVYNKEVVYTARINMIRRNTMVALLINAMVIIVLLVVADEVKNNILLIFLLILNLVLLVLNIAVRINF